MSASSAEAVSRRRFGLRADVCILAVLAVGCMDPAGAAVLGGMATSVGLLAALAALLMVKSWPEQVPPDALPALASLVFVVVIAWWARRRGLGNRVLALVAAPVGMARAGPPASPRAAATGLSTLSLPDGIERAVLLAELESHFVRLQAAWDRCDLSVLRELTTADMLAELCASRAGCTEATDASSVAAPTTIVSLELNLLGFEALAETCVVSVDFSGWARESDDGVALPFREVWMLVAPRQGGRSWRLARHHALL